MLVVGGLVGLVAAVAITFATSHSASVLSLPASARLTQPGSRVWIVLPGETLETIAASAGVSFGALQRLNPDLVPGPVVPGQHVRLPN
jgi:LysM repeat protein